MDAVGRGILLGMLVSSLLPSPGFAVGPGDPVGLVYPVYPAGLVYPAGSAAEPVLAPLLAELDEARAGCAELLDELPATQHWQGPAATAFADTLFRLRGGVLAALDELDAAGAALRARGRPRW